MKVWTYVLTTPDQIRWTDFFTTLIMGWGFNDVNSPHSLYLS